MIEAIITDIEGTTTDIHFVHDVLFPYAKQHLTDFIAQHRENPDVMQILQTVKQQIGKPAASEKTVIATLATWMQEDAKITSLKLLQGMMWKAGYEHGDFHGHLYQDAYEQLQAWHTRGLAIYVFSSGSVEAQKLLFKYSVFGDLSYLFSGYFDTTTGAKKEAESYQKITAQIGLPAAQMLFLSDIEAELDAAKDAGLQTCWIIRDGVLPQYSAHKIARDFAAIDVV